MQPLTAKGWQDVPVDRPGIGLEAAGTQLVLSDLSESVGQVIVKPVARLCRHPLLISRDHLSAFAGGLLAGLSVDADTFPSPVCG